MLSSKNRTHYDKNVYTNTFKIYIHIERDGHKHFKPNNRFIFWDSYVYTKVSRQKGLLKLHKSLKGGNKILYG